MPRAFAIATALSFAAFVCAKGIPTLRHDWNWPIDRIAIPSFLNESIGGWMPIGMGALNAHPTTYLIALPIGLVMWLFGPLVALALLAAAVGYLCMHAVGILTRHWNGTAAGAAGVGLFALFNPWVYNEVVAGHLVMVLAYCATIGMFAEMLLGRRASSLRLALWVVLIQSQLQFFIIAMMALCIFALVTKKWFALWISLLVGLPSIVGIIAERSAIVKTPYSLTWQVNQSVSPSALAALGGYFPGYADRLGLAAVVAMWVMLALALVGLVIARRRAATIGAAAAAAVLFIGIAGVHGPLAAPYAWIVRSVPESGVFRELYDLAGVYAALLAVLASAATAALWALRPVALSAGLALAATWLFASPSTFWVGADSYPHPRLAAPALTRVALLPAFQPLQLRSDGGDGADPDAHGYSAGVTPLNQYFPTYPVDAALARYEQSQDIEPLRALGVSEIVARRWLVSRSNGRVGLAALSPSTATRRLSAEPIREIGNPMPLISTCDRSQIVALANRFGACDVFFADAAKAGSIVSDLPVLSDSIDARTDWIDARLGFATMPELAQGIGGVLTESTRPYPVVPNTWVLAFVRGRLDDARGARLAESVDGAFRWIPIPSNRTLVTCRGLCELVAEAATLPPLSPTAPSAPATAVAFRKIAPWLYVVDGRVDAAHVLRLNERFDRGWTAIGGWHVLPHVRVDTAVNGWVVGMPSAHPIFIVQVTSFLQLLAELIGIACVLWLLKAAACEPTKRAS